jgi:hypothetical protein
MKGHGSLVQIDLTLENKRVLLFFENKFLLILITGRRCDNSGISVQLRPVRLLHYFRH